MAHGLRRTDMNREKVYTAPSAEVVLLMPAEELAGTWGFNEHSWHAGFFTTDDSNPTSGVGVIYSDKWPEDGYTYNGSTS